MTKINCYSSTLRAAGKKGFHRVRTLVRFELTKQIIQNLEVVELGAR